MTVRMLTGDCRELLKTLPDASVQCCVTSPPYFGLRDYGTASWQGGDATCDHRMPVSYKSSTLGASSGGRSVETHQRTIEAQSTPYAKTCGTCGAKRVDQQIGLEGSVEEYVAQLVAVFREVRRVLKNDGTLWLNLASSYAGSWGAQSRGHDTAGTLEGSSTLSARQIAAHPKRTHTGSTVGSNYKPKDLIPIPWLVGLALQQDGWWLRRDHIWHKPNCMPESATDRATSAHEYVLMFSKAPRYFYDAQAVAEPSNHAGRVVEYDGTQKNSTAGDGTNDRRTLIGNGAPRSITVGPTRNMRSVWTIPTASYSEAHFAVMAPAVAERCIKAGSAPGDVVLDPFGGAGTVSLVAERLGRDSIYIDLSPEYAAMARKRIYDDAPMFADVRS